MLLSFLLVVQVFDAFKARLQESNSKVNLHALESLQKIIYLLKDSLSQVVNILVPAIVDNHLNSKNSAIYSAANGAINALTSNLGINFKHLKIRVSFDLFRYLIGFLFNFHRQHSTSTAFLHQGTISKW